jgi:hypothetical protein
MAASPGGQNKESRVPSFAFGSFVAEVFRLSCDKALAEQ